MKQIYTLTISIILSTLSLNAQNVETFEDETSNTTTFTNSGQSFVIESGINENFSISNVANFGWDGGTNYTDDVYVDNIANITSEDGSSFTIKTTDGTDIKINSLYLFVGSDDEDLVTNETLTIEGKKDGNLVYTITKTSGFNSLFQISNGFTFIDFTTENATDNSIIDVDELVFTSTLTADYLALDYFIWSSSTLSTSDFENSNNSIKLFPNPSSDFISVSNLKSTESYLIINQIGQKVKKGILSNNEQIDIRHFANGLYFLKFDNGNTIQFIKE